MRLLLSLSLASLGLVPACRTQVAVSPVSEQLTVARPGPKVTAAIIGDFGLDSDPEAQVAGLVASWAPDIVLTLGDNNYPSGSAGTMDENVGKHYGAFIGAYQGKYGSGAAENRFFPSLGNHDWRTSDLEPYIDYFALPGNERYYDFVWGPVHFFAVDSDNSEPDGVDQGSAQARWLKAGLQASTAPWQVVYMHHPPYSSGDHGSSRYMQWPFTQWGADAVLAGHDHHYERLVREDGLYFVNGLGGNPKRYDIRRALPGSVIRYNEEHGAMLLEATATHMRFRFVTAAGAEIDAFEVTQVAPAENPASPESAAPVPAAEPRSKPAPPDFEAYED